MTRGCLLAGLVLIAPSVLAQQPAEPMRQETDARAVVGPPQGPPLSGAALAKRTEEVASLLRCPVCQGLSVAASPASMALKMKAEVKEMLAAGYGQDQILVYFEHSYGEFVRLQPPLRGVNWTLWLAPLVGLFVGGAVVVWALRRTTRSEAKQMAPEATQSDEGPGPATLPADAKLGPYVLRVRELAYGWPGGVPPGAAHTETARPTGTS